MGVGLGLCRLPEVATCAIVPCTAEYCGHIEILERHLWRCQHNQADDDIAGPDAVVIVELAVIQVGESMQCLYSLTTKNDFCKIFGDCLNAWM